MCDQFDKDQLFLKPTSLVPVPGLETYEAKERIPDKQKTPFPPPNGGAVAWLQVAGAFFLFFNSW
jgi:hypothetical protein